MIVSQVDTSLPLGQSIFHAKCQVQYKLNAAGYIELTQNAHHLGKASIALFMDPPCFQHITHGQALTARSGPGGKLYDTPSQGQRSDGWTRLSQAVFRFVLPACMTLQYSCYNVRIMQASCLSRSSETCIPTLAQLCRSRSMMHGNLSNSSSLLGMGILRGCGSSVLFEEASGTGPLGIHKLSCPTRSCQD